MAEKSITPEPISTFIGHEFLRTSQFLMIMPINRFIESETSREIGLLCESVEFPGLNAINFDYTMAGKNKIKVPYSKEYQDVTLTFLHNVNVPIYYQMIDWVRAASGEPDGTNIYRNAITVPYFDDYVASFKLLQLTDISSPNNRFGGLAKLLSKIDRANSKFFNSDKLFNTTRIGESFIARFNEVTIDRAPRTIYYSVEFYNAYPISVQSVPSNWGDDGYQKVSVTFTYEYFTLSIPIKDQYERG